jgi:hypothetical protein
MELRPEYCDALISRRILTHCPNEHSNALQSRQQGQGTILILDRSVDVAAAILHEFTYQAMANDLLTIEDGTKYTYEVENAMGDMESVSVVIDESDQVFMDIRHAHIVETASTLTAKFNKFVADNEALRGDKDKAASLRNMKDQLANLPQFQDQKAKYSTHIHIAKECMRLFEQFKINELGLVEQQLATGETVDGHLPKQILAEMVPLLDDPDVSSMDKLRLLMLYTICRGGLKAEDRDRLYNLANISGGNAEAIRNLGMLGVPIERVSIKDSVVKWRASHLPCSHHADILTPVICFYILYPCRVVLHQGARRSHSIPGRDWKMRNSPLICQDISPKRRRLSRSTSMAPWTRLFTHIRPRHLSTLLSQHGPSAKLHSQPGTGSSPMSKDQGCSFSLPVESLTLKSAPCTSFATVRDAILLWGQPIL